MRILVSNDDGVLAAGLPPLVKTLSTLGAVETVVPDRDRSGASNSLTLERPLRMKRHDNGYIAIEGTPTDCVHLAITGLLDELPDIVVSGINNGPNLGDDILYSGTVAAAMEGRYLGYPALAISLGRCKQNASGEKDQTRYFNSAAEITKQLITQLIADPLPASTMLNVNVPNLPLNEIRGIEVTRLGCRHKAEPTVPATDPRGKQIFWIGMPGPEQDAGPGTDFHALKNDTVSITPLQLDLTHYKAFEQISGWVDRINWSL